jgi:hypothetical protein
MRRGVVLGEIIGQVIRTPAPVDDKLALCHTVADPVKPHILGLGVALFDCAVGDSRLTGIVGLDRGGWLGMAHALDSGSQPRSFLGVVEQRSHFGFRRRGHHHFHDGAWDVDGTICGRGLGVGINSGDVLGICGTEEENPPARLHDSGSEP